MCNLIFYRLIFALWAHPAESTSPLPAFSSGFQDSHSWLYGYFKRHKELLFTTSHWIRVGFFSIQDEPKPFPFPSKHVQCPLVSFSTTVWQLFRFLWGSGRLQDCSHNLRWRTRAGPQYKGLENSQYRNMMKCSKAVGAIVGPCCISTSCCFEEVFKWICKGK